MKDRTIGHRENYLRTLEFRHPDWIPAIFELKPAVWTKHGEKLEEIVLRHPLIFSDYEKGSYKARAVDPLFPAENGYLRDDWGCLWHNTQAGILGQVVEHPLADWQAFDAFRPPDPLEQYDWHQLREKTEQDRRAGLLTQGFYDFAKGGFFDRLQFLRGLENLLVDFMLEPPQLWDLINSVLEYNMKYIRLWLEIGVDQLYFHGDIGTQKALLISPTTFRKYLKPAYQEMFSACRKAGTHVWYSSDGHVLPIVDDLIECGVTLHDPQVRANTVEGIGKTYQGKLCALVDIDQQMLPFCTPEDVWRQVKEVVSRIGTPEGGLMIYAEPSSDVPLANIEALCLACEEFCYGSTFL